jgi:hypothetical protein
MLFLLLENIFRCGSQRGANRKIQVVMSPDGGRQIRQKKETKARCASAARHRASWRKVKQQCE